MVMGRPLTLQLDQMHVQAHYNLLHQSMGHGGTCNLLITIIVSMYLAQVVFYQRTPAIDH